MRNRSIRFYLFIVLCLIQLYVPASMIATWQEVSDRGKEFRFRVRPIDPGDPFRGKFLDLSYEVESYLVNGSVDYRHGEQVYLTVKKDPNGLAAIESISRVEPVAEIPYFKSTLLSVSHFSGKTKLWFKFPFDKYFLNEDAAPLAEQIMGKTLADTSNQVWGLVSIYSGRAVLKDLYINGSPFTEIMQTAKDF